MQTTEAQAVERPNITTRPPAKGDTRERPILFSAPMVRALLAGTKTQTRRVVKGLALEWLKPGMFIPEYVASHENSLCPYGYPGDRLWVRETWQAVSGDHRARHIMTHPRPNAGWIEYAATPRDDEPAYKWRPSIHMPRWASRITLEVTDVRIERLQDISEADAQAEGVVDWALKGGSSAALCVDQYRDLWQQINGAGSWDANPWVWVLEFRRITA